MHKNQWQKSMCCGIIEEIKNRITVVPYLRALRASVAVTYKHESKIFCYIGAATKCEPRGVCVSGSILLFLQMKCRVYGE